MKPRSIAIALIAAWVVRVSVSLLLRFEATQSERRSEGPVALDVSEHGGEIRGAGSELLESPNARDAPHQHLAFGVSQVRRSHPHALLVLSIPVTAR